MAPPKLNRKILEELLKAEPTFPSKQPTECCWQSPPHPLASIQSVELPGRTDTLIIGSGITGVSVAKHLLEQQDPSQTVAIVEARTLCSGATGRNGGQVVTFGGLYYSKLKQTLGREEASKVLKFEQDTCDAVYETAKEYAANESEIRKVTRVMAFEAADSMEAMRRSVAEYESDHPDCRNRYKFITGEEVLQQHGVHGVVGAVLFEAAAIWPYRFVMRVIDRLRQEFSHRIFLEANTVVTEVIYDPTTDHTFPYKVSTPRGVIRARRVIHCSNGYSGRFLPTLRGRLFPFRGIMTVQDLGTTVPNRGAENSWNLYHPPRYDAESSIVLTGVYYLQQNPKSGQFFYGGCGQTAHTVFDTDDSYVETASIQNLQRALYDFFGEKPNISDEKALVAAWSGIMGFTGDGFPLVGRLPGSASQYPNDGIDEWIAVGFNGMGMCQSWRAGEAVANMVMDQDVSAWLPASFEVSSKRLHGSLTVEASVKSMDFYLLQNDGVEVDGSMRTVQRL